MLTPEEEKWSIADVREQIRFFESGYGEWRNQKVKELKLVLKYKMVKDRMKLEAKIRSKLGVKKVSGNWQPEDVAKVLGIPKRQAMVIEKKALSKLKSPRLGKQLKNLTYK